jgi:hypothetical protein
MSETETLATRIQTWLKEKHYQIEREKYRGGSNEESWHISLALRSDFRPIPEHHYDELSVAIRSPENLAPDATGQIEIWITDMHEQMCDVEFLNHKASDFWESFDGFISKMAKSKAS